MNSIRATICRASGHCLILACSLLSAPTLYSGSIYSQPYTFWTLAGSTSHSGRADGTGANAQFYNPSGVALDSAGNVYVADAWNNTIRKITPAGLVSTLAGWAGTSGSADGTGANARFANPYGVAVDSAGNVYVADSSNHAIRKITPAGVVSTLAGWAGNWGSADGIGATARFHLPRAVAVDSAGNVYVADSSNQTIRKVTPAGVVSTLAGQAGISGGADGTGANARFDNPYGVAVDSSGNVYVADYYNCTIRKITPAGGVSTLAGLGHFSGSADGTGANARFDGPYGVAVDSAGNVYVADSNNHTIRKVTPTGGVSTLAGLAGYAGWGPVRATGANVRFNSPSGVAVDSVGNLYVADTYNYTIRFGQLAPPPPLLGIRSSGGQVILSWPLEASNFLVEARSTLFPVSSWMPLTNAVGLNENSCVLTNSLETGARFFRLRLP